MTQEQLEELLDVMKEIARAAVRDTELDSEQWPTMYTVEHGCKERLMKVFNIPIPPTDGE